MVYSNYVDSFVVKIICVISHSLLVPRLMQVQ